LPPAPDEKQSSLLFIPGSLSRQRGTWLRLPCVFVVTDNPVAVAILPHDPASRFCKCKTPLRPSTMCLQLKMRRRAFWSQARLAVLQVQNIAPAVHYVGHG
jgi:hypothetical protein